jgi:hypothetical protein
MVVGGADYGNPESLGLAMDFVSRSQHPRPLR